MRAFTFLSIGLATLGLASCSPGYKGGKGGHGNDFHGGHRGDNSHGGHRGDDNDGGHGGNRGRGHCISRAEARDLADSYAALVGEFNESDAQHWLADDFLDYSDSINAFTNKELGSATFNKESFIASQSSGQLPPTPITVEGEPVVDCDRVAIVWSSTFGKGWPAKGLTVVDVTRNEKGDGRSKWLMTKWDVEFNSLAWAYNMGQYYCLFGQGVGELSACGAPKARGLEWE